MENKEYKTKNAISIISTFLALVLFLYSGFVLGQGKKMVGVILLVLSIILFLNGRYFYQSKKGKK